LYQFVYHYPIILIILQCLDYRLAGAGAQKAAVMDSQKGSVREAVRRSMSGGRGGGSAEKQQMNNEHDGGNEKQTRSKRKQVTSIPSKHT